jgi:RHS repeat-associated protein
MKVINNLLLSVSPSTLPARKPCLPARSLCRRTRRRLTGKEQDAETGLYYYGARYLDSRTGRWLSGDPALGEYVPSAPVSEEARKRNGSLPGMGGVFNYVNLHVYHYAGNNPVKYTDPDGKYLSITNDTIYNAINKLYRSSRTFRHALNRFAADKNTFFEFIEGETGTGDYGVVDPRKGAMSENATLATFEDNKGFFEEEVLAGTDMILTKIKIDLNKIYADAEDRGLSRETALMWTIAHEVSHGNDFLDMGFDDFWNEVNSHADKEWDDKPHEQKAEKFALQVFDEVFGHEGK